MQTAGYATQTAPRTAKGEGKGSAPDRTGNVESYRLLAQPAAAEADAGGGRTIVAPQPCCDRPSLPQLHQALGMATSLPPGTLGHVAGRDVISTQGVELLRPGASRARPGVAAQPTDRIISGRAAGGAARRSYPVSRNPSVQGRLPLFSYYNIIISIIMIIVARILAGPVYTATSPPGQNNPGCRTINPGLFWHQGSQLLLACPSRLCFPDYKS